MIAYTVKEEGQWSIVNAFVVDAQKETYTILIVQKLIVQTFSLTHPQKQNTDQPKLILTKI